MTYEEYVAEYRARLVRLAATVSSSPRLAEDLVQDVLVRAFEHWHVISHLEHPHAYVRRMVVNEYLSWRRRFARVELRSEVVRPNQVDDHAETYAERAALIAEISKLSQRHRTVLALRFFEELTDAEIGQLLGCSPATVRSMISRALAKLRIKWIASEPLVPAQHICPEAIQ